MLYLLLAILCSAAMALLLKRFEEPKGSRCGLIFGNYLACTLIALLMTPGGAPLLSGSRSTPLFGLAGGLLFVAGFRSTQASIRRNGVALSTAFSKLGLLVTLGVSFFLFGERPDPAQLFGIALVVAAILLIHGGRGDPARGPGSFALLLLTLLAVGSADSMVKVFEGFGAAGEGERFFLCLFATACLLTGVLALVEFRRTGKRPALRDMAAGALVAVPNYFCSFLLLHALMRLPAFLVYSAFSTGTILAVMLLGALLFGERTDRRRRWGLLVILAALVLLNL
ncbi:MAG: EamA family transporter [Oscillospiraceae bacterium]|nr:EamA family transporter [Oscillospiraceae bacterium]